MGLSLRTAALLAVIVTAACGGKAIGETSLFRDAATVPDVSVADSMPALADASLESTSPLAQDAVGEDAVSEAADGIAPPEASTDSGLEAGPDACVPRTCAQLNYDCGKAGDGCGGTLRCGTCAPPSTCGGGGAYNQCGTFDGGCLQTCADALFIGCSDWSDGCGHLRPACGAGLNCSLPPYGTCGGGGTPYHCGSGGTCTPLTCADLGYDCGTNDDGCGGRIDCGTCTAPAFCGGGGFDRCGPTDAGASEG